MKSLKLIFVLLYLFTILGCNEIFNNDDDPVYRIDPNPILGHSRQEVSINGDKLVFENPLRPYVLNIINLKSGTIDSINLRHKMPVNIHYWGAFEHDWCPYDNNKLLLLAVTSTDTIGDGRRYHYGQNLYFIDLNNSEIQRITPLILGQIGATGMNLIGWLPESLNNQDIIQISFSRDTYSDYKLHGQFLYLPQKDEFEDVKVKDILATSNKENIFFPFRYSFSIDYSNYYETIYSIDEYYEDFPINRYKCRFDKKFISAKASWSPNGKYIALSVTFDEGDGASNAIWIIDVENFLTNKPYILNPKQIKFGNKSSLRLYSEVWAEFLTDSTLAATMYKPGDDFAFLWEITIDGKIVRQLTFEP